MNDDNPSMADPFGAIADEFVESFRQGKRPSVEEFARRYPEHANAIRDILPALVLMEKAKSLDGSSGQRRRARNATVAAPLQQVGDYRILREVGRGGMGVVYEAQQLSLGRHVAIKVLPSHALLDPRQLARFQREARSAARLHHTNIVPVFGVGEQDGLHYYVMQFIQGLGLDVVLAELQRLRQAREKQPPIQEEAPGRLTDLAHDYALGVARSLVTGKFTASRGEQNDEGGTMKDEQEVKGSASSLIHHPSSLSSSATVRLPGQSEMSTLSESGNQFWQSVARVGMQVADALTYAASQGVLHRDIKPSNLLLDDTGNVWVTDFGLAKADDGDNLTHTGDIVGTLRYMAPERFNGQGDLRSDIYSLGLTLYEMLTLRPAFNEANRNKLVKEVMHGDPVRPRKLNRGVPRDLETVVLKAIARDPAHRYQTPAEMTEDLKRFVEDRPVRARRISGAERMWRWSRRNPLVAGLMVAVVLLLVAGSVLSTVLGIGATLARIRADASAREAIENAQKVTEERNKALAEKRRADREAEAARSLMYVARINSVQMAFENSNLEWGLELLKQAQQGRAATGTPLGWEWTYHWRFCHSELRTLEGHQSTVTGVAVNPDGTRLVSCSQDETLREWDTATGQQLRSLSLKGFSFPCMAMNADGTRLAVGSIKGAVEILDATTWQVLHHIQAHARWVRGLAFSPDGARLATVSDDRTLKTWSVAGGHELRTFAGHTNGVRCVAFSPDGQWLATGGKDLTVRLWNTSTGQALHTLRNHTAEVNYVAFSPDGRLLASAGQDWVVRLWDLASGQELHTLTGHTSEVRTVAFSPDGKLLASAGHDRTVKLWDVATAQERSSYIGHQSGLYSLGFSPDGRWFASGSSDKTIRLWSVNRTVGSRVDRSHSNQVRAVEFSPDGKWLASVGLDGKIVMRDVVTGQAKNLTDEPGPGLLGMAFSPDSQLLATGGDAGIVTIWKVDTGRLHFRSKVHTNWLSSLAFSPDGKIVASGSNDKTIKLLDAANGQLLKSLNGHKQEVKGLAFTADGRRLFSGSSDDTIRIWDVASGQEMRTLKGHTDGVTDVALSPDNRRLASCSSDRTVKIWDVNSGRVLQTLTGHNDTIWCVRFFPDGDRLVSAGWDQAIWIWDLSTGSKLASLKGHPDRVLGVAISPDGGRLASAGGKDLTVQVWDGRPLNPTTQLEAEAVDVVNFLFSLPLRKSAVVAYLNSAPSFRPPLRQLAIELAERFADNADAKAFYDAAWRLLKHPHANATMCQFTLSQMTSACELSPDSVQYRTALAAAQYRLGKFQKEFIPKARATLAKCDNNDPITIALLAMTLHRLDEREKARASFARLRRMMQARSRSVGEDAVALVREAGLLIDGVDSPRKD